MIILKIISWSLILIGIIYLICIKILSRNNSNPVSKKDSVHDFAILIPARDESKVIERLLISIKNQTQKINMNDVYIIVEKKDDLTIGIAKKYDCQIVFRSDISLSRKGYALDDGIKYILNDGKTYSAYFIFDADNVLDKNYLRNMTETYDLGYDIGIGYRNCKNGNDSVVSAASSLVFSMINTFGNKFKNEKEENITISGTGFYIRGEFIEKWRGFPFHELTEDYELTLYTTLNNMTSYYNKKAIFFDEQPVKYKDTINQRIRWIRGYFDSRKRYLPKIKAKLNEGKNKGSKFEIYMGVKPYIFMVIGIVLNLVVDFIDLFIYTFGGKMSLLFLYKIIVVIVMIYFILMVLTYFLLLNEKNSISLKTWMKIKVLFYFPVFLTTFVSCAIKAILKKEVKWERVEHSRNV